MTDFERAQLELGAALMDALDELEHGQEITIGRDYNDDIKVYWSETSDLKVAIRGAYEAEKAASKEGA